MKKFKYKAINQKGRPVSGVISAASEGALYKQLQVVNLELVSCAEVGGKRSGVPLTLKGISTRDLIQLFLHLEQMQGASVPLLDALGDIRDTTDNHRLRDIMGEVYRDVNEGVALSEALSRHGKIFHNLYISIISAGEETGDLVSSYRQLIKYLKWKDEINRKVRKAITMPAVTAAFVFGALIFLMIFVVPQILQFVDNMKDMLGLEVPWFTKALKATSDFIAAYWMILVAIPFVVTFVIILLRRYSENFRYRLDLMYLSFPIMGNLIRKISIARFSQTFAALFASGVDVIKGLNSAKQTVNNLAINEALDSVISYVKTGSPLSEAFNASGEFPSMVVRMIKIGEESGNLTHVLEQVGEFYTNDVNEAVDAMVAMIQPLLTAFLGIIIFWIIAGSFGPIYLNLDKFIVN
ncbi:MAG: type II secretion system F family protein [Rhodospirillales bacterium]|nr:type II secretion system F family protein [Rhodospirillales bacterium]